MRVEIGEMPVAKREDVEVVLPKRELVKVTG